MSKLTLSVYINGGLGNEMFQIAAVYAFSLNNKNTKIILNEPSVISPAHYKNNNLLPLKTIFPNIPFSDTIVNWERYIKQKRNNMYDNIPLNFYIKEKYNTSIKLIGVFASHIYFKDHYKEIIELFKFNDSLTKKLDAKYSEIINNPNTISLHFRRGDKYRNFTLKRRIICIIDISYYYKCIDLCLQDNKNSVFVLFYEPIDNKWFQYYIIKYLDTKKAKYIIAPMDLSPNDTLYLMTKCKNNILTNSTFSFWGGFLNTNPNKKVYFPEVHSSFKNPYKRAMYLRGCITSTPTEERVPTNWIQVKTFCLSR